jgi:hypothetical protein
MNCRKATDALAKFPGRSFSSLNLTMPVGPGPHLVAADYGLRGEAFAAQLDVAVCLTIVNAPQAEGHVPCGDSIA